MADFFTFEQLHDWPSAAGHLQSPARLAVIGDPVGHSKSPQMHNPALKARGIDAQYVRVQVPIGRVKEAFALFVQNGFIGVNITIPHKFEALDAVDVVDPLAQQLGAVNTLAIREGKMFGYNTDGPGFLRSAKEAFGVDVRNLRVLILGAGGGAGRAVAVQCALEGCWKIVLANRTPEKAQQLERELRTIQPLLSTTHDIATVGWDSRSLHAELENVDLIVNATSIGMKADDPPLVPLSRLRPHHLVYDMVYRANGDTSLIAAAKQAGVKWADGMSLLLHQGAISFEHWFGGQAPLEVMREGLRAATASTGG